MIVRFLPSLLGGTLLLAAGIASAQDEMPAVTPGAPATSTPAAPAAAAAPRASGGSDSGTTIFGERESPIGLYITPWRDARAERDIDRPARLLQEKLLPVDRAVFAREVEYHEALAAELKRKGVNTPQSP